MSDPQISPAPTRDPIDEALDRADRLRQLPLRSSLLATSDTNPEQAAEARRLAMKFLVPPALVERNLDEFRKREQTDRPVQQIHEQTPTLAGWLEDPQNAKVAHDDLEQLGFLEWLVTAPQRAYQQTTAQMRAGELRAKELMGVELTQEERDRLNTEKFYAQQGGALGARNSWFRGAITGTAQFLANQYELLAGEGAKGAAIGATTGAVIGGVAGLAGTYGAGTASGAMAGARFGARVGLLAGGAEFTFKQEAAGAFDEYLDFKDETGRPIDHDTARAAAIFAGAVNAALETGATEVVLRTIPGVKQLGSLGVRNAVKQALRNPSIRAALGQTMKEYAGALTAETMTEVAQRASTILSGELAKAVSGQNIEYRSPEDVAKDLAREGAGAVQTFAFGLAAGPAVGLVHEARRAQAAERSAAFFTALGEGVHNSKTAQRLPEAARDFIARATENGPLKNVYAPIDTFTQYWQDKGLDPREVASELTGDDQAYDRALRTGEDLAISTANYAVKLAGTEHNAFFAQELRLGPDEMNARERDAFKTQLVKRLQQEAQQAQQDAAQAGASPEQVRRTVVDRLTGVGLPRETAERYAVVYEGLFGTIADIEEVSPLQTYSGYGLAVERPELETNLAAQRPQIPFEVPAEVQAAQTAAASVTPSLGPEFAGMPGGPDVLPAGAKPTAPATVDLAGINRTENPVAATNALEAELAADPELAARAAEFRRQMEAAAAKREQPKGRGGVDTAIPEGQSYERGTEGQAQAADLEAGAEAEGQAAAAGGAAAARGSELRRDAAESVAVADVGRLARGRADARALEGGRLLLPPQAQDYFAELLTDARSLGYVGAAEDLAQLFTERHNTAREIANDLHELANDGSWRDLLVEVSKAGGIGIDAETGPLSKGYTGEIAWMIESLAGGAGIIKRGPRAGRIMPRNSVGIEGAPRVFLNKGQGGLSLDRMREHLAQDPRFERYAESDGLNRLLVDLEDAVTKGHYENQGFAVPEAASPKAWDVLQNFLNVRPGETWWSQMAPADLLDEEQIPESEVYGPADQADTSFNLEEFDQGDMLDTGELQPRLPGDVGAVRDRENATPQLESEFGLTTPTGQATGTQSALFDLEAPVRPRPRRVVPGQTELFQGAWHGSPHRFDRFSLHAIGTGEGAQAYGWGLYFASNREVAEYYRQQLSTPVAIDPEVRARAQAEVAAIDQEMDANLEALGGRTWKERPDLLATHRELQRRRTEAEAPLYPRPGRTYKVEIPENEDYLDWDKALSEQSPKVQAAIARLGFTITDLHYPTLDEALEQFNDSRIRQLIAEDLDARETLREGQMLALAGDEQAFRAWYRHNGSLLTGWGDIATSPNRTGEVLYRELADRVEREQGWKPVSGRSAMYGHAQKLASEALAQEGVAGIRYLDQFSRFAIGGEGTHNFVLFDDRLVQITQMYQGEQELTDESIQQWADDLRQQIGPDLAVLDLRLTKTGDIQLDSIAVSRGAERAGLGTRVMQEITALADRHQKRIVLSIADKGYTPAEDSASTTSRARLVRFYQRFGFVENKGRYQDSSLSIGVSMYREPTAPLSAFRQDEGRAPNMRRGSIRFGADRQMTISLFERADLSTFLHETGHFFLEVVGDVFDRLVEKDPETLTVKQKKFLVDYGAILKFLGVTDRNQITEQHHEQFARAFEAYLMEGKAPSLALRSAFASFRAWLLGIYRTLRSLNVNLTDEVRGVFDRMLATDQAIAEAEAAGHVAPLFTTAEAAGMTEREFDLYRSTIAQASQTAREQLERKALAEVQREQEDQWTEARAAIEAQVTKDVHAQPVYRALAAMQRGAQPDGTPLVEGMESEPLKLSRNILVARYGEDRLKRLPRPFIYARDGGLDPDVVAQAFGFSSGDELLTAIENATPAREVIQQETRRRMLAEHGSLLLDGSLHAKAQEAVANEDRELVVRAELRALGRLRRTAAPFVQQERQDAAAQLRADRAERTYERRWLEAEARLRVAIAEGRKQAEIDELTAEVKNLRQKARGGPATIRAAIPPASVIRQATAERIARTRIAALNPQPFWSAARRASQQATDAAARQDFDAAIVAKQQELLNLALFRETQKALEDVEKRITRAKALAKPATRLRLGLAGPAYLDQIDAILERYGFVPPTNKRRASLARFVAGVEGEGIPIDLPDELLAEDRRIEYRELTVEELVGVTDGLQQLAHLAGLKLRLLKQKQAAELAAVAGSLAESIRTNAKHATREAALDRRPAEERRRMIGDFFASHRKLASIVREMDGFQDGGEAWDALLRPLNDAGAREAEMIADATRRLAEIVERAFPGRQKARLYEKAYVPAVGRSLSRMERLMVALNWGNEGNRDRVRRGEGWDDSQVQAILDTLTGADAEFAQSVLTFIDSYWPEIKAKQERVYGVAPEKVEASPFTIAGVELRGGYFPLKYDDRRSAKAIGNLDLEAANLAKQAAYAHATTKRDHTKARASTVKMPVRRDFGVIFEHVAQVIHDLTHHEALIDVGRVLGHDDVQKAILETYGDQTYKTIRNTVKDVAFGDIPARNGVERAFNHVRAGATIAGLGWNVMVGALQPLGLANSIVRIGPTWVARGVFRWLRNPLTMIETAHWIEDQSAFMRARGRTQQREINEIRNSIGVSTGKLTGWIDEALSTTTFDVVTRQGIADSFFWLIQQMQRVADIPTWLGAYEKAMAAGELEARAVAMADQAVLDSQGGGQIKDLSSVQRGGPMFRLWTNFYSYFNVLYNQATESKRRTNFKHPAEVGRLAADYLMLFVMPATIGFFIRQALRPRRYKGDEDEGLLIDLLRENLAYLAGTMLFVRELGGFLQGYAGYEGPAGARIFADLGKLTKQIEQGEIDEALVKSLNEVAGTLLHYPASQIERTLSGLVALAEGKTENPGAVVAGPPPKRTH